MENDLKGLSSLNLKLNLNLNLKLNFWRHLAEKRCESMRGSTDVKNPLASTFPLFAVFVNGKRHITTIFSTAK